MEKFEVVDTEYGKVRGVYKTSVLDTGYISFQGIPYMKAPLGKLRFRDAEEPQKWSNILDATTEPPSYCTNNMITFKFEGQENAAIINVYTKNVNPEKLYPVMVWIHGGGFRLGSSKTDVYGPDYLLQKDVIVVSFNYRLGVLGFLSLEDESLNIPGNAGIKDQIFALKWVQRNIRNFGGDPDNVTVFGESAGGASVHYLTLCEQTKGLFHRAIIMSGSGFCKNWALMPREYSTKYAYDLASKLGWKGKEGNELDLLNFLEEAPAHEIMKAHNFLVTNENRFGQGILNCFAPVIEPYRSSNCIIHKEPIEMAKDAWSNEIDVLTTYTSLEGVVLAHYTEEVGCSYLRNPAYFIPLQEFNLQNTDPIAREYGERIKSLYYKDGKEPSLENQYEYLLYKSDSFMMHGVYRAVQSRVKYSSKRTFLMRFHVNGTLNLFKTNFKCEKYKDAGHADDLFYVFRSTFLKHPPKGSKELTAIERMVGIFTSFAITGDPNCAEIEPTKFEPQTSVDELKCIQITEDDVTEIDMPEIERLRVWDSVYADHDVPLY